MKKKKKPHKNLEHKQHAIEQSMGHRRYKGDYGMSPRDKYKHK